MFENLTYAHTNRGRPDPSVWRILREITLVYPQSLIDTIKARGTKIPADVNTKSANFRARLKGNISDFLQKEGMQCLATGAAIIELVVVLSHYIEERNELYVLSSVMLHCNGISSSTRSRTGV